MISRLILMYSGEKKHINLEGETTYKANIILKKKNTHSMFSQTFLRCLNISNVTFRDTAFVVMVNAF